MSNHWHLNMDETLKHFILGPKIDKFEIVESNTSTHNNVGYMYPSLRAPTLGFPICKKLKIGTFTPIEVCYS